MEPNSSEIKSRLSSGSLDTNKFDFDYDENSDSWFSEEENGFDDFENEEFEEDSGEINYRMSVVDGIFEGDGENNNQIISNSDEDSEEEVNSATFIMNQKSLADKAPGALQHSFAHRTIDLKYSFQARLFQFISIFVICSMTAGIPFGLPALRQLLVEAGIYGDGCGIAGKSSFSGLIDEIGDVQTSKRVGCSVQEGWLAVFQVTGWVSWMIGGWLAARSVQHYGPRNTGMMGCGAILVGSLMLAISLPSNVNNTFLIPNWLRMYIFPVMIMSIGSSFSFLACLHYVRLFPKRTSLLNSAIFLAQDLSAFIFYIMYESREFLSLRQLLIIYAGIMLGQVIFWKFVFSTSKIPTIRFTVTTWHQRPLLVEKSLSEQISSPYFHLALLFSLAVFLKLYFYMSTFQVQLRILLIPTKRHVNPEDFTYRHNDDFDENGNNTSTSPGNNSEYFENQSSAPVTQFGSYDYKSGHFFSQVPFFAEQPGGTSSNNLRLRQFIYNPMQPEIFLTDLQEMIYFLIPIASLITIFWMRSSMSDRKISTSLFFSLISLVGWGFVQ